MTDSKKEMGTVQSVLFIVVFWALVALLFAGMMRLLQEIDITGFVCSLLK